MSLLVAVALLALAGGAPDAPDPELARGIKLVEQGEYSQAILVLDGAALRLDKRGDKPQAAQAHLYLGVADVGESQETLARASFREALTRDPNIALSAFDVSPKVRDLFQKAKDERAQQAAAAKKGGSKTPWIILGVLASAGGGARRAARAQLDVRRRDRKGSRARAGDDERQRDRHDHEQ